MFISETRLYETAYGLTENTPDKSTQIGKWVTTFQVPLRPKGNICPNLDLNRGQLGLESSSYQLNQNEADYKLKFAFPKQLGNFEDSWDIFVGWNNFYRCNLRYSLNKFLYPQFLDFLLGRIKIVLHQHYLYHFQIMDLSLIILIVVAICLGISEVLPFIPQKKFNRTVS